MPCGLGQHPYFPCGPQTRLDTHVTAPGRSTSKVLPVDKVPAEGRYDLQRPPGMRPGPGQRLRRLGRRGADDRPRLAVRSGCPRRKRISSSSIRRPTGGIFVAEPVTHANAALNAPEEQWPELGMRVLEPGEEMSLTCGSTSSE